MMALIITVPHNCVVPQQHDRGCDRNALTYANAIHNAMDRRTLLIPGDIRRSVCDLNRIECRDEAMRLLVTDQIHNKANVALIDVHTFQFGKFPIPGGDKVWFVIMSGQRLSSAMKLCLCMHKQGFGDITKFDWSYKNDIVEQSNQLGLPAALIEIREDLVTLSDYDIIINKIAMAIDDWINNYCS